MPALIEVVSVLPVVEINPNSPSIVKGLGLSCAKALGAKESATESAIIDTRTYLFIEYSYLMFFPFIVLRSRLEEAAHLDKEDLRRM